MFRESEMLTVNLTSENDTTVRVERDDPVRPERSVVGLHTGDLGPVADDVVDHCVILIYEIGARAGGLEVRRHRASALSANELCT